MICCSDEFLPSIILNNVNNPLRSFRKCPYRASSMHKNRPRLRKVRDFPVHRPNRPLSTLKHPNLPQRSAAFAGKSSSQAQTSDNYVGARTLAGTTGRMEHKCTGNPRNQETERGTEARTLSRTVPVRCSLQGNWETGKGKRTAG